MGIAASVLQTSDIELLTEKRHCDFKLCFHVGLIQWHNELTTKNIKSNESFSWMNDIEFLLYLNFESFELLEIKTPNSIENDNKQNIYSQNANDKTSRIQILYHNIFTWCYTEDSFAITICDKTSDKEDAKTSIIFSTKEGLIISKNILKVILKYMDDFKKFCWKDEDFKVKMKSIFDESDTLKIELLFEILHENHDSNHKMLLANQAIELSTKLEKVINSNFVTSDIFHKIFDNLLYPSSMQLVINSKVNIYDKLNIIHIMKTCIHAKDLQFILTAKTIDYHDNNL